MSMTPKAFGLSLTFHRKIESEMDDGCSMPGEEHPSQDNSAMKRLLLLLFILLFVILLTSACNELIISVTIIMPKKFVPYYDWLMDFPGLREPQQIEPQHPIPMRNGYYSVTSFHHLMTFLKLTGNKHRVKS